jgi:ubiquitin C-terminal hydrolase
MANIYSNKGLTGLCNLGNTCFINSCIQILSNTYELNDFLNDKKYMNKLNNIKESILIIEWDKLRELMWHKNCTISPNKFIKTIQKVAQYKNATLFTNYSQNDVSEFLLFIIDCFHNSLSREVNISITGNIQNNKDNIALKCFNMIQSKYSKDYSEILTLFYGTHVSQIISIESNEVLSITPEPYFIINLPIPKSRDNITLYDCFDLHIKGEILSGDNAWYNENTKQYQNIKKNIIYWDFPNILVIDLKRFDNNQNKNNCIVNFPINELNLVKYVIGYKPHTYIYELYGICNHIGNYNGGHYTAFIKNANNKWYYYNDERVVEVMDIDELITSNAYCFFYRKKC